MSHSPPPRVLPHAPVLGLTHRILGRFHVTGVFWYRFAHWAFTRLPPWTEWISVSVFTTFFFLTLTRIRRALSSNSRARPWSGWDVGGTVALVPNAVGLRVVSD